MFIKSVKAGPLAANCYIIADLLTGVGAVIDAGGYKPSLKQEIADAGIKELKYILCTHGHFDHISGVAQLKAEFAQAVVAIGEGDSSALSDPVSSLSDFFRVPFNPCTADKTLKDGDVLEIGNLKLQVISASGHSPGGVIYYCPDEAVMFTGDTIFKGSIGRTDLYGSDASKLIKTLEKLKAYPANTVLYSGHTESTTLDFELKHNPFLK